MERFKIGLPNEDNIIKKDMFIADKIFPLCIRKINNNNYSILFFIGQDSTEEAKYCQMMIGSNINSEIEFLDKHPLNFANINKDMDRLKMFIDFTKGMNSNEILATDFDMKVYEEKKVYYYIESDRKVNELGQAEKVTILIPRDNFIKVNLFFTRLMQMDISAETVFFNPKLSNIEFCKINHVKLDGSATDISSKIVCNHYTCGLGPTTFKFNFISPKFADRKLRKPLNVNAYNEFYSGDFVITDMIYDADTDSMIVIYEERSDITSRYKKTLALIFDNEFYTKTNLLKLDRNYEPIEKEN